MVVEKDGRPSALSRWWGIPIAACAMAISFFAVPAGNEGQQYALAASVAIFTLVILLSEELHLSPWFWGYLVIMAAAHGAAVAIIPWPKNHDISKGDGIFLLLDLAVVVGPIELARWFRRRTARKLPR